MGRRQHLARLALGRSAFEKDDEAQHLPNAAAPSEHQAENSGNYVQQYDSKGRPINPAIEDFNSALRDAQNAVLELVGVVERKDRPDQFDHLRHGYLRAKRNALLSQEDDYGELLDYGTVPLIYLSKLWANVLLERVQIGYYSPSLSMADILASEWGRIMTGGPRVLLANLFPASGATFVLFAIKTSLVIGVEQITGRLQRWFDSGWLPHRTVARMYTATSWLFEGLLFTVDAIFVPLEFYATAQRLGVAPLTSTLPNLTSLWPRSADSFHSYGWRPTSNASIIRHVASPGLLMMCNKVFSHDMFEESTPIMRFFTAFRYPKINEEHTSPTFLRHNSASRPPFRLLSDPIGWLLYKQYALRRRCLQWCGWTIVVRPPHQHPPDTFKHDINTIIPADSEHAHGSHANLPIYRSTHLAHLPAKLLATFTDHFLSRLILLPFQSLMLRTIAAAYLAAPSTTKTASGIAASATLYRPFGGSPLSTLLRSPTPGGAWSAFMTYASRLGLGLALNAAVDTFLFFGVYWATRKIGGKYFEWGQKGHVGVAERNYSHRGSRSSLVSRGGSTDTRTGSNISAP